MCCCSQDYDLIKTYVGMPDEWQQKITEYAHLNGMTVSSHEIFPAARYGVNAVEHIVGLRVVAVIRLS